MSRTIRSRAVLAACVGLAAGAVTFPGPLRAQAIEFTPYGGVLLPVAKLVEQGPASLSHRPNVVFGGRLDAWLSATTGLEVTVGYSPAGYHAADTLGATLDTAGGLLAATGRFVYRFARVGRLSWDVTAGVGLVNHSGSYISSLTGRTHLTGVAGLTGRFQVSRATAVVLTAEDYVYSVKLGGIAGIVPAARLNNVVVFSVGVVVPLGARGDEDDELRVIR